MTTKTPPSPTTSRPYLSSRYVAPVLMLGVVAVGAALPVLRNHIFYMWDDTAAVGLPNWLRMADAITHGRLPLLELDMWRGGDLAAEGVGGMWNPVIVLVAIAASTFDNMALAITLGKTFFMMVMALGSYLLARGFGIRPTLSAAYGTMLPFAGYSLFVDGTAWVNALILSAFTPWLWWAARRVLHRDGSVLWVIVAAYLCLSLGNPYGLISTAVVLLAVMVEAWVVGNRPKIVWLALAGGAALLLNVQVYLPLMLSTSVGFRADNHTFNNEFFSPDLNDLATMSTPSAQPYIISWALPTLSVPAMYLAWFVLPLLPWLRWRRLVEVWRPLTSVLVLGGVFGLLMLGPSQIWLFRWPLRLIDFVWLAAGLAFMVLANFGLHRTHRIGRAAGSLAIIVAGGYLGWADTPTFLTRHVAAAIVVAVLVALLIRFDVTTRLGYGVLALGTLLVLGLQVFWFPGFYNVLNYQFPNSRALLEERFAKYEGLTVQLADLHRVGGQDLVPDRAYKDMLFGNMYSVAGVESTTAYSGIGFTRFDNTLCAVYQGSTTCPEAWGALWRNFPGYDVPLADLLRARTVVVQNKLIDTRRSTPPEGWRRDTAAEESGLVTVWKRIDPLPFPGGRLSHATPGVSIVDDRPAGDVAERVRFHRDDASGPAALTFARLAWPGYTATVDGRALNLRTGPAGLVVVDLPAGVTAGEVELTWSPPGATVSAVALYLGAALSIGLVIGPWYLRRRTRRPDLGDAEQARDDTPEPVGTGSLVEGGVRS
ncbi:MAG TPA: hypothetical protein VGX25_00985 [Actinophytocola sp.]|uniref:hypothetical protein n=1 Tax=Actinophytocola sp. TaxID=1872138 RepID=UPI002DDD9D35|nr:hypothetical protein [Actinophytocola sp.]HEV2777951.1 hypothetical protein [Actinophytocola sp.]